MAKFGNMAILAIGLMTTNYGHDGYPWKEHNNTNLPVKKSSDLDVWVRNYSQNKDFKFLKENIDFPNIKKWPKIHHRATKSKF